MKNINYISVVTFFLVSYGCSFMDVQHRFEPGTPFASYHSFQWMQGLETTPEEQATPEIDENMDQLIRSKITQELNNKNFNESSSEKADFLINYRFITQDRVAISQKDEAFRNLNYRYPRSMEVESYSYRTGSLILDVIDPNSREVVWQGNVYGFMDVHTDPKKQEQRLEKAVRLLLADFPPKQ